MRDETFLRVLDEAVEAIDRTGIPWALIGGIASVCLGRPRWTRSHEDIDFFIRHEDASVALEALEQRGFETEEHNEQWIYKGTKEGVLVDLIFRSSGNLYLDEDMIERFREVEFRDRKVKVVSPEDLLVMKVVAHGEETFSYWWDALGLVARNDLDWDYLIKRATRHGARRTLSLLLYAESEDLVVPWNVIEELYGTIRQAS